MAEPFVPPLVPIPSPFPNIDFPRPYWINQVRDWLLIECTDPDLLYVAMAFEAAIQAAWTIITPSTKQLIEETTGKSWVCHAKTTISGARRGGLIASDGWGNFLYGLARGLDVFAYYQFVADIAGEGLINWMSMIGKNSKICDGAPNPNVGRVWHYGAPYDPGTWGPYGTCINSLGQPVGASIRVRPGEQYQFLHWGGLQGLNGTPCQCQFRHIRRDTGEVVGTSNISNPDKPNSKAILKTTGAHDGFSGTYDIDCEVSQSGAFDNRIVSNGGGCYAKSALP